MNRLSLGTVIAALALPAPSAGAGAFADLIGPSYHTRNSAHTLNNATAGGAVGYAFSSSFSVRAGGYRNSYYRPTWFIEADELPIALGSLRLGAGVGVATGYRAEFPHPVAPMVGVVAQFDTSRSQCVQLRWLPFTGGGLIEVFNLSLRAAF
jgi:hypothetical protein